MGVDLILLPYYNEEAYFSHTILEINRDYDLFDKIKSLPMLRVLDSFTSYVSRDEKYEEPHYGKTIKDPYGDAMKYTHVRELLTLRDYVIKNTGPKTKGAWAYMLELSLDIKVALYWS